MASDNHENKLRQRALSGMVWKLAEKVGMQVIQFAIQIVLARKLLPEEYGLVGLLTIFITVSDVFILQGFTTALIQRKDVDDLDYSSVFYANIAMAAVLYGILYLSAPGVAAFYHEPALTALMRVLSLNVLFGAFSAVHNAVLSRALDFKKSFLRNTLNILTQGVVGIGAAYMGLGAWSLVFSKLAGTLVGSVALCVTVRWKLLWQFSLSKIRSLFSFSSKVLTTNLLNTIFNNLHSLVIGRYYTSADLGYYQKGQQMPQAFMTAIDGSFSEVLYPALSTIQDDLPQLKSALRRSMKTSMFLVMPMLMGVIATAEPLTVVLLTEKWLPCVPFMQLQCVSCMFWPLAARTHALNAIGKSNVTLRLSVITKLITVVFIVVCIRFGIFAIMLGSIAASLITFWITSYYVKKYISYTLMELLKDLAPCVLLSAGMLAVTLLVGTVDMNVYWKLALQVLTGVAIYIGGAVIFRIDSLHYVLRMAKGFLRGRGA